MEENDEWKEIEDFPGYYVSRHGEVYSSKRGGHILSQSVVGGQRKVNLSNGWRGSETRLVHRLVGDAFLPKPEEGTRWKKLRHIDDDLQNNDVENLEWS